MLSINGINNVYASNYYGIYTKQSTDSDNINADVNETITTWEIDEEGDIVYYTLDKKTKKVITKTKYINPNKLNIKHK